MSERDPRFARLLAAEGCQRIGPADAFGPKRHLLAYWHAPDCAQCAASVLAAFTDEEERAAWRYVQLRTDMTDRGPEGQGWRSPALDAAIARLDRLLPPPAEAAR